MLCVCVNNVEDIRPLLQAVSQEVKEKMFDADRSCPYGAKAKNGRTMPPLCHMAALLK
jgi:hypothetical protein